MSTNSLMMVKIQFDSPCEFCKTMIFPPSTKVTEVLRIIKEKTGLGGKDHGLLQYNTQAESMGNMCWLNEGHTIEQAMLPTTDRLFFQKKHKLVKFRLVNGHTKALLVDMSIPIREVVRQLFEKLDLPNYFEYSVFKIMSKTPSNENAKQSPSKAATPINELRWLNPNICLTEHGVVENEELIVRKTMFATDQTINPSTPLQVQLHYAQSRELFLKGTFSCQLKEAIQLAALDLQIHFGNCGDGTRAPGSLQEQLRNFLPERLIPEKKKKLKKLEEKLLRAWLVNCSGLSTLQAQYRYFITCRTFREYGIAFYPVKIITSRQTGRQRYTEALLGILHNSLRIVDKESQDVLFGTELWKLRKYMAYPNQLHLDFGDYHPSMVLQTSQAAEICQLLSGYIDFHLHSKRGAPEQYAVDNDAPVAVVTTMVPVVGHAVTVQTTTVVVPNPPQHNWAQSMVHPQNGTATVKSEAPRLRHVEIENKLKQNLSAILANRSLEEYEITRLMEVINSLVTSIRDIEGVALSMAANKTLTNENKSQFAAIIQNLCRLLSLPYIDSNTLMSWDIHEMVELLREIRYAADGLAERIEDLIDEARAKKLSMALSSRAPASIWSRQPRIHLESYSVLYQLQF